MFRIGKEEIDAVARVIESKNLFKINDAMHETEQCEELMREKFGVKRALLVTSGMGALASALIGMGIGPGDEVIVPAYTYIATAMAVVAAGAVPVIVDIDETYTMSAEKAAEKINPRTKCIIPVHIQGFPCAMDEIKKLADENGIMILEDACQADGGSYKGKRLGAIGNAGALSFNQFKIITAGEGGALITNDDKIYERALIYHDSSAIAFFGDQLKDVTEPQFCGTEFRTNEISAAILHQQLLKLDDILFDLRKNKRALTELIGNVCRISPSNDIEGDCGTTLPVVFKDEQSARQFSASIGVGNYLPIDTGKHIYDHWTAILEKRGAFRPEMDPFRFPENADHLPDYKNERYPVTLDLLARTVFILVDPDWTDNNIDEISQGIIKAAKGLSHLAKNEKNK
ncbi:MAG: aminotransferase class I/II-fold pyridoxal phosphate-dependent enzyme [Clostridiales bacterium]|nr:aminotransferase class I/II-fold pyridoxal phosphate-dependent enzyme [Clostridiales bacterium]